MDYNQTVKELTVMLLYMTSWKERGYNVHSAWKGYDFDILNELGDEGILSGSKRAKSVVLQDEGVKMAKELLQKYQVDDPFKNA